MEATYAKHGRLAGKGLFSPRNHVAKLEVTKQEENNPWF